MYPNAERLNCGLCHNRYNGFASRNPYGLAFQNASGNVTQKLMAVEGIDSDGDGTLNGMEIMTGAGFMPGFTCDTYQNLSNAPADIADFVDPNDIGCNGATTTTNPPVTTTNPPVTTTNPPVTTTNPPVTTTNPPVTTTNPPMTTTTAPSTTSTTLVGGCRQAAKSVLTVKRKPGKPDKDKLVWKWSKGDETLLEDLGMPMATTSYSLLVADPGGTVVELTIAPSDLFWTAKKSVLKYADKTGSSSGVIVAKLKAAETDKAQAMVKGKGAGLGLPALGLGSPVSVILSNSLGQCWQATYATAKKNDDSTFKAIAK